MQGVPQISTTELVDESGRPLYARESALEAAFLAIRAAHAARMALAAGVPEAGVPYVFPVACYSVFEKSSGCGAAGQRAIEVTHEPGSVFLPGITRVSWRVTVLKYRFEGVFHVSVGNQEPPRATCTVVGPGDHRAEVPPPLPSVTLTPLGQRPLDVALRRQLAAEGDALTAVMRLSEGMVKQIMRRLVPRFGGVIDENDARQEAYRAAVTMARRFGSSNRQKASWGRVFMLGITQSVEREINKLTGMGRPELAVRKLIEANPAMASAPIAVVRAELERRIAEAATWADDRIEQARHGPPSMQPLAAEHAEVVGDAVGGVSMGELLRTLLPDVASRRAAMPYLIDEGWVPGDRATLTKGAVSKAKTAFMEAVARALSAESATKRGIIEMFAAEGERYDREEDREAMMERARTRLGSILHGAAQ